MFCHVCGIQNDDGSRFCRSCGALQIVAVPESAPEPVAVPAPMAVPAANGSQAAMVCPTCRTEFPPPLKFCERDGTALVSLAVTAGPPVVPEPAPEPEPEPELVALPLAEPSAELAPTPDHIEMPQAAPSAAVAAAPVAAPEGTQFCENCGCRLSPEDVFCCECGARNEPLGEVADTTPSPAPVVEAAPTQPEPEPEAPTDEPLASETLSESRWHGRDDPNNPLPWLEPAAAAPVGEEDLAEGAPDTSFEDQPADPETKGPGILVWVLAGLALLGAAGGAGYFWWDQLTAIVGLDESTSATEDADAAKPGVPRVAGTYAAFLMDQEIEISFEGNPAVLAESKGTVRYFNTVNGGRCVSQLVAIESGGIGGDPSGKVLFSQQPKDGEPPCGKDIPMLIDIDKQAMGEDGLVSRLAIEWQSPETKAVLMSGNLDMKR